MSGTKSLQQFATGFWSRLLFQQHNTRVNIPINHIQAPQSSLALSILDNFLWFAVPKQKISRHKKRLKTTVQNRIPLKKNIIVDPRTGEVTLQHKLPGNWKDYLPQV
jgi:ribosomal protein L32